MAEKRVRFNAKDTVYGFPHELFDPSNLPDVDRQFIDPDDLAAFERALQAPDPLQGTSDETAGVKSPRSVSSVNLTKRNSHTAYDEDDDDFEQASLVAASAGAAGGDLVSPTPSQGTFITAQHDWAPVNSEVYRAGRKSKKRKKGFKAEGSLLGTRTKDETREGYLYQLSKWPLLFFVFGWLGALSLAYFFTRWYIFAYEHFFTWRGQRETLRRNMRRASNYNDWVAAAKELDSYLGRKAWREENKYAYYDFGTVKRVWDQMRKMRIKAEAHEKDDSSGDNGESRAVDELRLLVEASVKNNFVGVENARLYSQTYYGTKNLVQNFLDEGRCKRICVACS